MCACVCMHTDACVCDVWCVRYVWIVLVLLFMYNCILFYGHVWVCLCIYFILHYSFIVILQYCITVLLLYYSIALCEALRRYTRFAPYKYHFDWLMDFQVDTASIVGSHQLQEQSAKHQQELKELSAQLVALRQKNDDLCAQLQVRVLPAVFVHFSSLLTAECCDAVSWELCRNRLKSVCVCVCVCVCCVYVLYMHVVCVCVCVCVYCMCCICICCVCVCICLCVCMCVCVHSLVCFDSFDSLCFGL